MIVFEFAINKKRYLLTCPKCGYRSRIGLNYNQISNEWLHVCFKCREHYTIKLTGFGD